MPSEAVQSASVEDLLAAITAKLESNQAILERSVGFGRLTWRQTRNGEFEIKLEPQI